MKKLTLLFSACFIMLVIMLSACKKDNKESKENNVPSLTAINAKVYNGETYNAVIDSVYMMTENRNGATVISKTKYQNGGFSANLATPPANALEVLDYKAYNSKGLKISDTTVKVTDYWFVNAFDKKHERVGRFELTNMLTPDTKLDVEKVIAFQYVDKPLSIIGTETKTIKSITTKITFNLNFVKGWNIVLMTKKFNETTKTVEGSITITTTVPDDCKWVLQK